MAIIILLIGISLSIAILFLVIFYWNMKTGQYDDPYTPAVRILFENKPLQRRESGEERDIKAEPPPSAQNSE